jgi:hypothetical protein
VRSVGSHRSRHCGSRRKANASTGGSKREAERRPDQPVEGARPAATARAVSYS